MTEKRFTFADGFKIVAIKDNDKIMNSRQVCNKLNDLEEARSYYQENFLIMKTARNQLKKENKELKEKNKFILKQIKAFRDDCATYLDFDGVSTLNRLLDILDGSMEIWE